MRILSLAVIAITLFVIVIIARATIGDESRPTQPQTGKSPHGDNFTISCNVCHSTKGWEVDKETYSFDHFKTKFPLIGQHLTTECKGCHKSLVFTDANKECKSCHKDVHESTTASECQNCHTPHSWLVTNSTKFHQLSRFPLVGVHAKVDCEKCHSSGSLNKFEVIGTECFSCHSAEYNATTKPNHISVGYSTQCNDCHTIFSDKWESSGFNHSFFPLTSGHAINCTQCHTSGTYTKLTTECVSCHLTDYNSSANPNHVASNFPKTCSTCHTTTPGWKPAKFDHSSFPLTQGHANTDCAKCHVNGNYTNTSTDCYSCHQPDYAATTNPNHLTSNFSTSCIKCHTTASGWKPAKYDHSGFPLTQGHAITDCAKCHVNGNYASTSTNCYSCHQTDYAATTNPNHLTSNFSTTCTTCHTTAPGWKPAKYDHSKFPLTQGHANVECAKCHINGNYSNTSNNCYSCHQGDYTSTTNPSHSKLGFSTTCTGCHTTAPGWKPATYAQHDALSFPIYSGKHRGKWNSCTDCHANTSNYSVFSCIDCHEHNKTDMDKDHSGVNGYAYNSISCLKCHPTGN